MSGNGSGEGEDTKINCADTSVLVTGKGWRRNKLYELGTTWDLCLSMRRVTVKSVGSVVEVQAKNKGQQK